MFALLPLLVLVFVVAYAAIALEQPLGVHKSASALVGAGVLWTLYAMLSGTQELVAAQLGETLLETAQVVFFLMGAMTIVEVVDAHGGFDVITTHIRTRKLTTLLVLVGLVTFLLSAILDNLTTTIVMVSLLRRVLGRADDRMLFAGLVVIAANAGGASSPIGDVTTTMLWIAGKITPSGVIQSVFLASAVNLAVPLAWIARGLRGRTVEPPVESGVGRLETTSFEKNVMFFLGLGILVAVPVFKTLTHLPPYLGILFGLGLLWLVGEVIHRGKQDEDKAPLTMVHALTRIDMSSIGFCIGILFAVGVLEHTEVLGAMAGWLDAHVGHQGVIVALIGLASAVVDNVPLVAASLGMYASGSAADFPWAFLAYCAGTGGSILVIGSAAGVAAMGLERLEFGWYARVIGVPAAVGYFAGIAVYLVQSALGG